MANEVVNRRLNIYIDQSGAEEALGRLTKKENELLRSIEKSKSAGKDFTREMQKLGETRNSIGQLNDLISGKILPSVKQAEAAVSKLRREIRALPADSEAAKNKLLQFKQAEAVLKQVKDQAFGVGRAMDDLKKDRGIGKVFDTAFGFFIGGGLLGVVSTLTTAVGDLFTTSIEGALEAEKASTRLRATLNNLGQDDVFERLSKSADDFAETFKFIDNDDVIGVFEQLITYGKLTEKQISQLTPVIIDFASKSQISLEDSASTIIKALEGNGKALKEYGIDVKDAKDETEAFGIIMTELKPKVEGSAKAFGETTAGQIAITRQQIENLKEDIGTELLPVIQKFYQFLSQAIAGIPQLFQTAVDTYNKVFNPQQFALDQLQGIIDANKKKNADFINALTEDFKSQSKEQQVKLATAQVALVEDTQARLKAAQDQGNAQRIKQLQGQLEKETKILANFTTVLQSQNNIVGTGPGRDRAAEEAAAKARKQEAENRKKELDDLLKKYKEFSAAIKGEAIDAEFGEIFAAFRKINQEAEKDLAQLAEFQKAGLVTAAEAEELSSAINLILDKQREALQKKFNLNPVRVPLVPTADFEGDINADAKAFGEQVFKELNDGIKGLNDPTWFEENIQIVQNWAGEVSFLFQSVSDIRANNERAAFEAEIRHNDERRASAKKLLDSKAISQREYDRRIATIDAQQEKRAVELSRRQFERDKRAQTVQALMSGAQAVVSTLAARPGSLDVISLGTFRAISIGLIAATTAAQLAAIRSAKAPQFEKGGFIPEGSSHKQGGISLIDNRTGSNVGEVEGGEPIISKKVYAQNRSLIDSLIWKGNQPQSMNIPRLNSSMQRMGYFETGGFIPGSGQDNKELLNAINLLNERLSVPLRSNVIYGEYEEVSDKIQAVRNAAVIR